MLQTALKVSIFAAIALLGILSPPIACAQELPARVHGITIPAIPGAPFSATAVIESEQDWSDGWTEVYRTINVIARDSKGRTHNESRQLMPESFHGSPKLTSVEIFDPATRMRIVYEPETHIVHRTFVPIAAAKPDFPNPSERVEDLGTSTMNGLPAKGTRHILSLSKKESGIRQPVDITDEVWYSQDLHLDLLLRHADPRLGTNTVGISNLKREEPPASLFDVPAGYQVLSVSAPTVSPAAQPPAGAGSAASIP